MNFNLIRILPQTRPFVSVVQLNRPKELNALSSSMINELASCLVELDDDDSVRVIVLSGNERAFAAGADIRELKDKGVSDLSFDENFKAWTQIRRVKKPMIAAVSGFALGGGCELALICDLIIASETALFGQPEIRIGVIPGAGGTQRMTKAIGKAKTMEIVLTGKFISADEALRIGLVNYVVPVALYLEESQRLASEIAQFSPLALKMAKESVLKSFEIPLEEGLAFERRNFCLLFSTDDQKEGMDAFLEKRPPKFKGR